MIDDAEICSARKTIRPRPLIAGLGALLGVVVVTPGIFECIVLGLAPNSIVEYPTNAAFCCLQVVGGAWLTYRWLTIRGTADERTLYLRGWIKTLIVPTARVAAVRVIEVETMDDVAARRTPHDILVDHDGRSLGTIPACLTMCRDWKSFRAHIDRLVVASRDRSAGAAGQRSHRRRSAGSCE